MKTPRYKIKKQTIMKTFKNISNSLVALPGYMLKPGQSVSEKDIHPIFLPNFYKMASLGMLSITTTDPVEEVLVEKTVEVVEEVAAEKPVEVAEVVEEVAAEVPVEVAAEEPVEAVEEVPAEEPVTDPKININTAMKRELQSLNGVGSRLADRIIQARPFSSLEELTLINGFSQSMLDEYSSILDF